MPAVLARPLTLGWSLAPPEFAQNRAFEVRSDLEPAPRLERHRWTLVQRGNHQSGTARSCASNRASSAASKAGGRQTPSNDGAKEAEEDCPDARPGDDNPGPRVTGHPTHVTTVGARGLVTLHVFDHGIL